MLERLAKRAVSDVDNVELRIGLADAFGRLRAEEGVPFLISELTLQRHLRPINWTKGESVIEDGLPSVGALVRVGKPAAERLISQFYELPNRSRLPALFVLRRVKGPQTREFLLTALNLIHAEERVIRAGLVERAP